MAKAAFNRKKNLFTWKLDLNLRKKLVKWYIWNIGCYGAETWTLRKVDQKHMESFKMWCWRRWRRSFGKIVWEMSKYYTESSRKGMSYIQ
jgi:hypothetical protein